MYIFKNAVKNLFRNKGRNIIVALIMLAMLTFTAISMIINSATDKVIENYKEQFGSEVYLTYDDEKIREQEQKEGWADIPEITDEMKLQLAESEYLKETRIQVLYQAYAEDIKSVGEETQNDSDGGMTSGGGAYYMPNLSIYGYNTPELMEAFKEGKRKIISGKMFETDNECIISEEFAKINGLKTGDVIKARSCIKDADFAPLELTVSGIFFDSTTQSRFGGGVMPGDPRNDILTTYNTMKKYQEDVAKTKLYVVEATYYLKNPDLLEAFDREAHGKGLHSNWKLATDEMSYNRIVKPAENLAGVSRVFLIGVLLVGSAVLVLLSVLSIRERKYEIGVLRAMGMKKSKVVRGILYETFIIIVLCLFIGLFVGAVTAQPVSDRITENQQMSQPGFGFAQVPQEKIEVSLTADAALKVSGIAVLLAVISAGAGVLYILRYEPMKILSERN